MTGFQTGKRGKVFLCIINHLVGIQLLIVGRNFKCLGSRGEHIPLHLQALPLLLQLLADMDCFLDLFPGGKPLAVLGQGSIYSQSLLLCLHGLLQFLSAR